MNINNGTSPMAKHVDRLAEWKSRLAVWSLGALVFLSLSGLMIWLLPFSRFNQLNILIHTIIGLIFLVPFVWYGIRHWLLYREHVLTQTKLLGYLTVFILIPSVASGLVLTYESVFRTKIGYFWRAVHDWTTIALLAFLISHLAFILIRDARARSTEAVAPIWKAAKTFGLSVAGLTVLSFAIIGLALFAYTPPKLMTEFPADYDLWEPHNPLYGKNRPFAPSLARTKDNQPLDIKLLSGSESCGTSGCHEQILQEWIPSAHRYSAMDKGFQAIQLTMAKQNGPTSTRYCGGCHDPISLFSGTKNISSDETQLTALHGYREGISCLSCHSVRETDIKGNAYYTIQAPPALHRRNGIRREPIKPAGGMFEIFSSDPTLENTLLGLSKMMYKKPEYCAACHKQFVDEEINKIGWVQLQNQYDNWRMSKWARDLKQPQRTIECRECHMPLVKSTDPAAGDSADYNRTLHDGMHRSHRFIGANQLMPLLLKLPGSDKQIQLTKEWLQGHFRIPEIEDKWHNTDIPAVSIQLITPQQVRPGEEIKMKCVITSNKVGHDFPTGPLDIIQAWIELVAKDENGKVVFETGTVDEKGFIKPGTFLFKAEPVDQYGNLIDRHNLWEMVGVRNRRSLFPGFSDTAEFSFLCPELFLTKHKRTPAESEFAFKAPKQGQLTITAKLRYRKVDQFLLNFIRSVGFFNEFEGQFLTSPVTDMHEQNAVIQVAS